MDEDKEAKTSPDSNPDDGITAEKPNKAQSPKKTGKAKKTANKDESETVLNWPAIGEEFEAWAKLEKLGKPLTPREKQRVGQKIANIVIKAISNLE